MKPSLDPQTHRRPRRRFVLGLALAIGCPIALYIAAGVFALSGFYRSNGLVQVTNGCESTVYVEVAGNKIGSDGFTLAAGETVTVERPHTDEVLVWRDTPVDNTRLMRIPIPEAAESLSIADRACPG